MPISRASKNLEVLEVAASLFVTLDGKWMSDLPAGTQIIGHVGLPAIDSGTKQILLKQQQPPSYDKKDFVPNLAIHGKDLFGKAAAFGSTISGITGYIEGAKALLKLFGAEEDSPELKAIIAESAQIKALLGNVITGQIADRINLVDGPREDAHKATRTFLNSLKPEEREQLRQAINSLHVAVSGGMLDPEKSFAWMTVPWDPDYYADTPWYLTMWFWRFDSAPFLPDDEVPLLGTWPKSEGRWDLRPYLGLLAETATTLISAHTALDPSYRTTGVYREYFASFGEAMRAFARRVLKGIQPTRAFDLIKDGLPWLKTSAFWEPVPGWPVGAVDSLLGSSSGYVGPIWTTPAEPTGLWRPSEQGFPGAEQGPLLVTLTPGKFLPSTTWNPAFLAGVAKANAERIAVWFHLAGLSLAPELFKLAEIFDDMATPPKESETVVMGGPGWTGVRVPAGKIEATVGGEFCEAKSFTADVYHLKRTGTVMIRKQPLLYQWGSHEIKYRLLLESHLPASSYPYSTPLDQIELLPGSNTVWLKCQLFDWDVEKPYQISDQIESENVVYVMTPPPPLDPMQSFSLPLEGLKIGSVLTVGQLPQMMIAETPLEERKGRITATGEKKTLPFHYERTDGDGLTGIQIRSDMGQENTMLWLVVEEPIGFLKSGSKVIRTVVPLPMVGIERHWSPGYFLHSDGCAKKAADALLQAVKKKRKSQPIPGPDPAKDSSYADYVSRVMKQLLPGPDS